MKTWKLTVNESELKALIRHHALDMAGLGNFTAETSARIHDLTKRLNRDIPEVEGDPRPQQDQNADQNAVVNVDAAKAWG